LILGGQGPPNMFYERASCTLGMEEQLESAYYLGTYSARTPIGLFAAVSWVAGFVFSWVGLQQEDTTPRFDTRSSKTEGQPTNRIIISR
jgi:hypothetical protein